MVDLYHISLPESFFEEEIRCNELVTKERKEIWALELDMLAYVSDICKKYDIKWFADAGTLLGAVRHKGFIPWDDDVDIMMDCANYDKFIEVCKNEIESPYFLNTFENNPYVRERYTALMRIDTAYLEKGWISAVNDWNKGVKIDIIPWFTIPDSKIVQEKYFEEVKFSLSHRNPEFYKKFYEVSRKYEGSNNDGFASLALFGNNRIGNINRLISKKSNYTETIYLPFECLTIPVSSQYEKILVEKYGNTWKEYIKDGSLHSENDIIFNSDATYEDYKIGLNFTETQLSGDLIYKIKYIRHNIMTDKDHFNRLPNLSSIKIERINNILNNWTYSTAINWLRSLIVKKYRKIIDYIYRGEDKYDFIIKDYEGKKLYSSSVPDNYSSIVEQSLDVALFLIEQQLKDV